MILGLFFNLHLGILCHLRPEATVSPVLKGVLFCRLASTFLQKLDCGGTIWVTFRINKTDKTVSKAGPGPNRTEQD